METTLVYDKEMTQNKNASRQDIVHFYDEATEDYSFWSEDLNMHFGYFNWKTNPLTRDAMLNEMNRQIYSRLQLDNATNLVADMGCGMGATMRYFLKKNPLLSMIGVTLSPFQVREGNKLLKNEKGVILEENYENTSIKNNSMDGCIGIESLCHSGHSMDAFKEAYRILKPGSTFVIGDAFLKNPADKLCALSAYSYKNLCKGWSLDGLGVITEVERRLERAGFKAIKIENISHRVAPSVLHVPFAIIGFLLKLLIKRKKIKPQSINNLKASFFSLLSGLHLWDFGYYIITAKK